MAYARPFTAAHFPLFKQMRASGLDFVEMLVPEPGEIAIGELRVAIEDAGLAVALAARINPTRDPTSADIIIRKAGREYLKRCNAAGNTRLLIVFAFQNQLHYFIPNRCRTCNSGGNFWIHRLIVIIPNPNTNYVRWRKPDCPVVAFTISCSGFD